MATGSYFVSNYQELTRAMGEFSTLSAPLEYGV